MEKYLSHHRLPPNLNMKSRLSKSNYSEAVFYEMSPRSRNQSRFFFKFNSEYQIVNDLIDKLADLSYKKN